MKRRNPTFNIEKFEQFLTRSEENLKKSKKKKKSTTEIYLYNSKKRNNQIINKLNKDFNKYMSTGKSKTKTNISNIKNPVNLFDEFKIDVLPAYTLPIKKKNKKQQPVNDEIYSNLEHNNNNINFFSMIKKKVYETKNDNIKKFLSEFFAVFLIEFFIILVVQNNEMIRDRYLYSLTYGFLYMIFFQLIYDISGAQLIPTISFALWLMRLDPRFSKKIIPIKKKKNVNIIFEPVTNLFKQLFYIGTQFLGTIVGTNLGFLIVGKSQLQIPSPKDINNTSVISVLIIETISSIIIVISYLSTIKNNQLQKPVLMGITIFITALVIHPITGAALNPFRWISPVLFMSPSKEIIYYFWAYIFSSPIAAIIGVFFVKFLNL